MSDSTINLTPELYAYLQHTSLREPKILQKLREQTHKMSMGHMQIAPEQGQLMGLLVELINAQKTLELGVFTGYSALWVALALPEKGKVVACDINKEWTKIAMRFWQEANVAHKIDLRLSPAVDTLNVLLQEEEATFDFAFIDADKANYPIYYEQVLKLLRVGGLIVIDNVLWSGKVADPTIDDRDTRVIRELNARILQDERVSISLLPIGDGVMLARKRNVNNHMNR